MSVKKNALSIPPLNAPIELSLNICMNCHICLCVVSELRQPFSTTHQKTNEIRCIIDKTSIYSNKMVTPGVDICAYCKKSTEKLNRLNNNDLLHMMKQHDSTYGRTTRFCIQCRTRAVAKLERRRSNQEIAAKKASRSAGNQTSSYSNTSNPVLSQSSSNRSGDQTSTNKRSRKDAGSNRNVARRTGGRPTRQADNDNSSSQSQPAERQAIPLFQQPPSTSSQSSNSSNSSVPQIGYLDDSDDNQNGNGNQSGGSMQVAPLPRHRGQRTEPVRQLTPERMRNMSSQERSQSFSTFNRGAGG